MGKGGPAAAICQIRQALLGTDELLVVNYKCRTTLGLWLEGRTYISGCIIEPHGASMCELEREIGALVAACILACVADGVLHGMCDNSNDSSPELIAQTEAEDDICV